MPTKKQLANIDTNENIVMPKKAKKSKKPVVKDLDGEIIGGSDEDDEDENENMD